MFLLKYYIYVYFLLGINEGFDDDLIQDSTDLLINN